jgi:transcriptional regulator with XRE-family HTH domain
MSRAKDKILNKEIGKKIRQARNVKPLVTQTKLGKALGVTFQQIQKYESGHNALSSIKLLEVSNFFKKPLEYFTSDATELLGKVKLPDDNSVIVTESLENV